MTEFDDLENQDFTEHQPANRKTNSLHPSKDDLADVEPGQQPAAKPADDDESEDDEPEDDESEDDASEDDESEEPAEKSENG